MVYLWSDDYQLRESIVQTPQTRRSSDLPRLVQALTLLTSTLLMHVQNLP